MTKQSNRLDDFAGDEIGLMLIGLADVYGINLLPAERVAEAMTAFATGVDVSAAHRIFGHDERRTHAE
jgi:hypothetical protein